MHLNGDDISGDRNVRLVAWKARKLADSVAASSTSPVALGRNPKQEFHEKAAIVRHAAEDHAQQDPLTLQSNDDIKK